jgi:hypothetical protein
MVANLLAGLGGGFGAMGLSTLRYPPEALHPHQLSLAVAEAAVILAYVVFAFSKTDFAGSKWPQP